MHMCASCGERRSWYQAAAFFWKSRPARSFGYYYKNWHAVKKSQGTSANQLFPHSRPVGAVSSHDLTSEGLPRACLTTPAVTAAFMLMHIAHLQHIVRFQEPFSAAATTRYYTGLQEILDIKILSAVFPFLERELLVTCGSFFQGQGSFSCSANQNVPWRAYNKYEKTTIAFKTVVQNTYLWGRELGTGRWAHSDLQIESTQWSLGIWLAVAQFPIGPSFDCSGYGKAFPFPSVC